MVRITECLTRRDLEWAVEGGARSDKRSQIAEPFSPLDEQLPTQWMQFAAELTAYARDGCAVAG